MKALSMLDQLRMIKGVDGVTPKGPETIPGQEKNGKSFLDFLSEQVSEVNASGVEAEQRMQIAATGDDPMPHSTLIALQKADISFNLLMSVERKLIEAYREILRTPIG